jgi:hypothetical protein
MRFLERFHRSRWHQAFLLLFVALIIVSHLVPAHAGCSNWSPPAEGDAVNLVMYASVVGLAVGFFLSGPLGWGITAGAVAMGGIAGIEGAARMMLGC